MTNPAAHHPTLHAWLAEVTQALELTNVDAPIDALLDVSRDVAHGVMRPAVPITMYLLGYAAGKRGDADLTHIDAERLTALVRAHEEGSQP